MPASCCCADAALSTWQVIVFHGETISAWRRQGYHESGEHANFRELLNAPKEDAHMLLQERFPVPMYVECDQYGSQARSRHAMLRACPDLLSLVGLSV